MQVVWLDTLGKEYKKDVKANSNREGFVVESDSAILWGYLLDLPLRPYLIVIVQTKVVVVKVIVGTVADVKMTVGQVREG